MSGNALKKDQERRKFRRVSDAIALQIELIDEAANEQDYTSVELSDYPTHVVSLSPNGLKCYHSEPFNDGDTLQLSMRLFPSQHRIDTMAKVVNSGEDVNGGKTDRFFAGVAFKNLDEDDIAKLLEHIDQVARQSFGGAVKLINS